MADIDDDDLRRWVDLINKGHGYAGMFNYGSGAEEKAIVEASTVAEWCRSIAIVFGVDVGEPERNLTDPPDCFVDINGNRLSVELVQMVEGEHKKRATKGESPYSGNLFLDMQWTKERLAAKLNEIIEAKGRNYARRSIHIDVLVIYTDEPWLNVDEAFCWLQSICLSPHPNVARVFLLFSYTPGSAGMHWPVTQLYGESLGGG